MDIKAKKEIILSNFKTQNNLYAGDILPKDAWELLKNDKNAMLIDVRTVPEWAFVGYPDLTPLKKEVIRICWKNYPQMLPNQEFELQLEELTPQQDTSLLFLCRSGGRSLEAALAMTAKGYSKCYNIAGGFEGDLDEGNHRGTKNCWKSANLPWGQN